MELKTAEIKLWEPQCVLPMGEVEMLQSAWRTHAEVPGPALLIATITPSAVHPSFVHYEVMNLRSGEWWSSKQPIYPSHVGDFLNHVLRPLGLEAGAMAWRRCTAAPPDANKAAVEDRCEYVYFLRAGPFIKIGKSTGSPSARIRELQTGCPFAIELAAHVKGGIPEESALHKRFAALRAHGEWFHDAGELRDFVASLLEVAA